jgi:hypothetical protein
MSEAPALLQLSAKSAACKGYPLVGCMPVGGYMYGLQGFRPAAPDLTWSAKLAAIGGSKAGRICSDAFYGREVRYWQTGGGGGPAPSQPQVSNPEAVAQLLALDLQGGAVPWPRSAPNAVLVDLHQPLLTSRC